MSKRIVVMVTSCRAGEARQQAIRETWGRRCPPNVLMYFVVGRPGQPEEVGGDTLYVDCPDTYEELSAKTLRLVRWSVNHLAFDWLFKCDDDTYCRLERLAGIAPEGADYGGRLWGHRERSYDRCYHFGKCNDKARETPLTDPWLGPWACGGWGYFLSRRAAEYLASPAGDQITQHLLEDKAVADCLRGRPEFVVRDLTDKLGGPTNRRADWEALFFGEGVSLHSYQPDELRNLHQAIAEREPARPAAADEIGFMTACDSRFFFGMQLLVASIRRQGDWPICVIDLGLAPEQRQECLRQGLTLLPVSNNILPNVRDWILWAKPLFLQHSPFVRTVWIDSDAVLLGDPQPLLDRLNESFTVFREDHCPWLTRNHPELYARRPVPGGPTETVLNAGVVALDARRDQGILDTWINLVLDAARDHRLASLIRWHDQGSLLWTLHYLGRLDAISTDTRWNWPANGHGQTEGPEILHRYTNDATLLDQLRRDHPDTGIVHWMGRTKLWDVLEPPAAPRGAPPAFGY